MSKPTLVAWIGATDLRSAQEDGAQGPGPIAAALAARRFDAAVLLNTYPAAEAAAWEKWVKGRLERPMELDIRPVDLPSPVDYAAIYRAATEVVDGLGERELTFHLSPGTPAMTAVWILLASGRYRARLVDSSREHGVRDVDLPFEIAAEFVPELVRRADERLTRLAEAAPPEAPGFEAIVHRSPAMAEVLRCAAQVAPRTVPVLIEGASGTGKELLARAVHHAGPRRSGPFVPVNCGAIPASLLEAELFGHERGAFTGAERTRLGVFEMAEHGTLFLDEVGELPLDAQVKLLRVLQEGKVRRIGGTRTVDVDVRVVAATNRRLAEEVAAGRFRADLYYRLAVAVLALPPLAEREGDVGLLVDHHLARLNAEQRAADPAWKDKKISAGARKLLLRHPWPGNVRELVSTLTRALIWSESAVIAEPDLRRALLPPLAPEGDGVLGRPLGAGLDLNGLLADVARHYLERALAETGGNKTRAAELVGLPSYQTFTNWMERYGVKR